MKQVTASSQVTVLEAGPAAAAGATGKSWAWLNANAKKPQHYRGEFLGPQSRIAALSCSPTPVTPL
jgi:glycine/D-amino acid oxidase-like deaminating enzyme